MNYKHLLILLCLILAVSVSFATEMHCWRQDKSRAVEVDWNFSEYYSDPSVNLIVPKTAIFTTKGFGNYVYECENGASGQGNNYIEIYDNLTGAIIATNGDPSINGGAPASVGSTKMCMVPGTNNACYIENGVRQPGLGDCEKGAFDVGKGLTDDIQIPMTEYKGEQDWTIRLGEISPSTSDMVPGDVRITFRDLERINFFVDSSKPAVLIFPPTPLQKLNIYPSDGNIERTLRFTILNKSRVPSIIKSYEINCPANVTCELQKRDGENIYNNYIIDPNNAHMIAVTYKLNKDVMPTTFASYLTVNFSPLGYVNCPAEGCVATSDPFKLKFEAGIFDEQKFQLNVSNLTERKYCVDAEGHLGRTGLEYAPRINLYFGGNLPPEQQIGNLVSLNECSPIDYNTMETNNEWVYCTQNEFLVQLAAKIGLYSRNMTEIYQAEQIGNFDAALELRSQNAKLKTFDSYLRNIDLNRISRNDSVQEMITALKTESFTNAGYAVGEIDNSAKFVNLIDGMNVIKTSHGVVMDDSTFSPGLYRITLDLNETGSQDLGGLFVTQTDTLNPNMNVKVYFEKISEPKLDWFFYYSKDNYDGNLASATGEVYVPTEESRYTTNYVDRGTIMFFEGKGALADLKKFYKTLAAPLIFRIVDAGDKSDSDSAFTVASTTPLAEETFSLWTGFASSEPTGCGNTSTRATDNTFLPYRVLDTKVGANEYEIPDFNSVKPSSKVYISTVIYAPVKNMQLIVPFKAFTIDESVDGVDKKELRFLTEKYAAYTIDSLGDVFEGIKNQKVCVYYDSSTSSEKWHIFWNQDYILDDLKNLKKSEITSDGVTICETRDKQSS